MATVASRSGFGFVNAVRSNTGVSMSAVIAFTCSSATVHPLLSQDDLTILAAAQ